MANFSEEENIYLVLGIYIVIYLHTCFNWYVFAISIFSFIFQVSLQFSVVPRHIVVPFKSDIWRKFFRARFDISLRWEVHFKPI